MTNKTEQQDLKVKVGISIRHLLGYALIFIAAPLLAFVVGKSVDTMFGFPRWPAFPYNLLGGLAVFLLGLSVGIKSTRLLLKRGEGLPWGEFSRQSETKKLVTTGLYAYSRNPMILGYSLLPCGMGLMFQSIGMASLTIFTFIIAILWAKVREEPRLLRRFGDDYLQYRQRVPLLFPKPLVLFVAFWSKVALAVGSPSSSQEQKLKRLIWLSFALSTVSLLCLCLIVALTFFYKTAQPSQSRLLAISLFSVICLMGSLAALSPSTCSQPLHHKRNLSHSSSPEENKVKQDVTPITLKGHHPTCGSFTAHVFTLSGRTYCAGCVGLFTGAVVAVVGSIVYVLQAANVSSSLSLFVFWLGFLAVLVGLLQYARPFMLRASIHFLMNSIFVVGALFLLIGVIELNGSLALEMYLLIIVFYWIFVRIILSRWEHQKTCALCRLASCRYFSD